MHSSRWTNTSHKYSYCSNPNRPMSKSSSRRKMMTERSLKLDYTDGTFTASVTDTEGIKTATVSDLSERWMAMHVILEDTAILIYASDGKKSSLVGQALVGQRYKSATAPIIIGDMDGRIAELSIYGGYEPTIDGGQHREQHTLDGGVEMTVTYCTAADIASNLRLMQYDSTTDKNIRMVFSESTEPTLAEVEFVD